MHLYSIWLNRLENFLSSEWNWKNKHGNTPSMLSIKLAPQMTDAFLFVSHKNNSPHFFRISFGCDRQTASAHVIIVLCVAIFFSSLTHAHIEMLLISIILFFIETMLSDRRKPKQIEESKREIFWQWLTKKCMWKFTFRSNENMEAGKMGPCICIKSTFQTKANWINRSTIFGLFFHQLKAQAKWHCVS